MLKKKPNKKRRLFILGIVVTFHLLLLSTCAINSKKRQKLYNEAIVGEVYDAIIVPGYPFKEGEWDRLMRGRVLWAYHLYSKGLTKNIIFSGSAVYSPYVESKIMALYAIELGVPAENVFTETRAEHSTENVFYGYHLGKSMGFERMALATDPFQSKMLKAFIRSKVSKDMGMLPMLYDTLTVIDTFTVSINPESAFIENFVSLEDRESGWKRFKGTRGKNIDYSEFKN